MVQTTLPITRVVLFKHGIAYIERQGNVNNDQEINLYFKSNEMNDVLKSLSVIDFNDGIISSISYDANKSVSDQIADIAIAIPDSNDSLTGLLQQLVGSKVRVTQNAKTAPIEGQVLGTEFLCQNNSTSQPFVSLLVGDGAVHAINLLQVANIEFLDENLKGDLAHLLHVLISSKKKDAKQLTIFAAGKGKRVVNASYIIEAPVWKTSYRLLMNKDKPEEALIQGWAVYYNFFCVTLA